MKSIITTLLIAGLTATSAHADLADKYFNKKNPTLTPQERAAITISERWKNKSATGMKPFVGQDGSVQYMYGAQRPSIVCAVLQLCDIALQPGEQVNSINLGDTARWIVEPAITGSGRNAIQHLIIKPMDVGLDTSLIVTTDRRTYNFKLTSHRTKYMAKVSFAYPEDAVAKFEALKQERQQTITNNTISSTGQNIDELDFNYSMTGSAPWKPVRVYNDGVKTIIQMPKKMNQTEAPTLLVIREGGGAFKKAQQVIVNYRVQDNRYIVDAVFDRAIMIAGVGSNQNRITINRK